MSDSERISRKAERKVVNENVRSEWSLLREQQNLHSCVERTDVERGNKIDSRVKRAEGPAGTGTGTGRDFERRETRQKRTATREENELRDALRSASLLFSSLLFTLQIQNQYCSHFRKQIKRTQKRFGSSIRDEQQSLKVVANYKC